MFYPIIIDTSTLPFTAEGNRDIVEKVVNSIVKDITVKFAKEWEQQAIQSLGQTRGRYLDNLKVIDEGRMSGAVVLDYTKDPLIRMIEEGVSAFDMKCIVNSYTKIYTSKGWKNIKDIKIGELVLTHKGKFQRVSGLFKEKNNDEFIYKIKAKFNDGFNLRVEIGSSLAITKNHPILTNKGWVRADELNSNLKICVPALKCNYCEKLVPTSIFEKRESIYCNKSCAAKVNNEFRKEKGRVDLTKKGIENISKAMFNTNKRLYKEGKHVTQTGKLQKWLNSNCKNNPKWGFGSFSDKVMKKVQKNAAISWGKANKGSDPESKLWEKIKNIEGIERQFLFKRDVKYRRSCDTVDRNRKYFFDFAIPKHKICIEVNGERWHTQEQDDDRRKEVEAKDWRYLSFWSKEIYSNIDNCVKEIERVLKNHNKEYFFTFIDFEIKKIKKQPLATCYNYKYNLTIEDDSSYIANGIVTHNSGYAKSSKKKMKADGGWYLTIPFRFATPGAIGESSVFSSKMPQDIYDVASKKETTINIPGGGKRSVGLKIGEIPEKYQTPATRPQITNIPESKTFNAYKNKTSIYEGITKIQDSKTGQSTYMSFRRVSDSSDQDSWIHTGIDEYNLAGKAMSRFEQDIEYELNEAMNKILNALGF